MCQLRRAEVEQQSTGLLHWSGFESELRKINNGKFQMELPIIWSELLDSNQRPLEPHSSAIPNFAKPGNLCAVSRLLRYTITLFSKNQVLFLLFLKNFFDIFFPYFSRKNTGYFPTFSGQNEKYFYEFLFKMPYVFVHSSLAFRDWMWYYFHNSIFSYYNVRKVPMFYTELLLQPVLK